MQLLRLRLLNFRQHADTELEFGPGITGIIGPNGSGKTTILEAIAWALYGAQAVRGDKDSIRRLGAKGRAGVEVDLEFRLGAHEYRVTRGLSTAALHQDGQVIANSLKAVTDKLERTLGMTHDEFFNTYFTGQKELAVMAALGKTERAAFLSRVLGYERLREAQERVREVRNAVAAEVRGLEAGLPDGAALAAARQAAEQRLTEARTSAKRVDAARGAAQDALGREEPRWNEWMARRERTLSLDGERRMAEQAVVSSRQEFQRLPKGLAGAPPAPGQPRAPRPRPAPPAPLEPGGRAPRRLRRGTAPLRDAQREVITVDGKYFRRRLEQLDQPPAKLLEAEAERDRVLEESRRASARAGELRAQVEERDRASAELAGARRRAGDLERRLTARPAGYDPARHDAVRAKLAKLEPVALEAAALEERARRAQRLVKEAVQAEQQLSTGERRVRELTEAGRAEGFSEGGGPPGEGAPHSRRGGPAGARAR